MSHSEAEESFSYHNNAPTSLSSNERSGRRPIDPHEHHHGMHAESLDQATTTPPDDDSGTNSPSGDRRSYNMSNTQMARSIQELHEKIALLQRKQDPSSATIEGTQKLKAPSTVTFQVDADPVMTEDSKGTSKLQELVPESREMTWTEFANRYEDDQTEYAIEVVVEDRAQCSTKAKQSTPVVVIPPDGVTTPVSSSHKLAGEQLPFADRIRINSPHILRLLAVMDKKIDASMPTVMLRPFKLLVQYETSIRSSIERLQNGEDIFTGSSRSDDYREVRDESQALSEAHHLDTETIISHLRCLVNFMDKYVTPLVMRWKTNRRGKIFFDDLWYIFSPGEDIYLPMKERKQRTSFNTWVVTPDRFHGLYQTTWRVTGVGGGRPDISTSRQRNSNRKLNAFKINCYYIDYDGKYFIPVIHTFTVEPFKGAREVSSLTFFPIRFHEHYEKVVEHKHRQEKLNFEAISQSYKNFYYVGPTMTRHPCDCPIATGRDALQQEHIESEIIVDYTAALQKHPSWTPKLSPWKQPPSQASEVQDKLRFRYWDGPARSKLVRAELEHIYNDNTIDKERAMDFKRQQKLFNPVPSDWLNNEKMVRDEDLTLLTARIFAFILRTRVFAPLWSLALEPIRTQTQSLQSLQLRDNSSKDTIHALVKTHLLRKHTASGSELDTVRGKGKGLIFLLHGAPGVGKTFTAESVAAANGRPLFHITCGDLGLTPIEVEKALNDIFRAAQVWNCVLLLDECDVFLQQRDKTDLNRNSLVSVFLRHLEFYTGVLFLTTNRVGILDSAITSRTTWSVHYPPLDMTQTREIWKVNLNQLKERNPLIRIKRGDILNFAKEHFKANIEDASNWNGRQIQTACKVAMSFAEWDEITREEKQAMDVATGEHREHREVELTAAYFQRIAKADDTFKKYMRDATGRSEAQRAYDAQERVDTFENDDPQAASGSDPNNSMDKPSNKKPRISFSTSVSNKQRSSLTTQGNRTQDKGLASPDLPFSYEWQFGNSNGNQKPRSRRSSHVSAIGGVAEESQKARKEGAAGLSSSYGLLSPNTAGATAAVAGGRSQFASAKKRKRDDDGKASQDRQYSKGTMPRSPRRERAMLDESESGSDDDDDDDGNENDSRKATEDDGSDWE